MVGQHGKERRPWSDVVAILLGHDPRYLRDVTKIVNDPRGKQLAQSHVTESWVRSFQVQLRIGQVPGDQLSQIVGAQTREFFQKRRESAICVSFAVAEAVVWCELFIGLV